MVSGRSKIAKKARFVQPMQAAIGCCWRKVSVKRLSNVTAWFLRRRIGKMQQMGKTIFENNVPTSSPVDLRGRFTILNNVLYRYYTGPGRSVIRNCPSAAHFKKDGIIPLRTRGDKLREMLSSCGK